MSDSPFPQRFGAYVLERFLAAGGMAEVFVASRPDGRVPGPIALKRMLPQMMENPEYAAMFRDEASLASRLVHPNIVRVYDSGEYDGRLFMAMELIDGLDAASLVKKLRAKQEVLGIAHALRIGAELCAGLAAAHSLKDERGVAMMIIHRDVSPQNILISRNGEVKVTDFGVAKATGRETHTATGSIKGKIPYMAPEQALAQHIDQRVDQFAAGIVVWELITGQRLFADKNDLLMFEKIIRRPTPKPSSFRSTIPPAVDAALLRALAKNPDERFPDVGAFGRALRTALDQLSGWESADLAPIVEYLLPPPVGRDTEVYRPNLGSAGSSSSSAAASPGSSPSAQSSPSRPTGVPIPAALVDDRPVFAAPLQPGPGRPRGMAMTGSVDATIRREPPPPTATAPSSPSTQSAPALTLDRSRMRPPPGVEPARAQQGAGAPSVSSPMVVASPLDSSLSSSSSSSSSSFSMPPIAMLAAVAVVVGAAAFGAGRFTAAAPAAGGATGCARPSGATSDVEAAYELLLQSQMQMDAGDLQSAAMRANEAQARSGTAKGHFMLGRIRIQSGDVASALTHYRCVLELGPGGDEAKKVASMLRGKA
jgi:serine/threonine protein kinase